jgi:hypothetical protein
MANLLDLPLCLSPPMRMTPAQYLMDIGLTYLIYPVVLVALVFVLPVERNRCVTKED